MSTFLPFNPQRKDAAILSRIAGVEYPEAPTPETICPILRDLYQIALAVNLVQLLHDCGSAPLKAFFTKYSGVFDATAPLIFSDGAVVGGCENKKQFLADLVHHIFSKKYRRARLERWNPERGTVVVYIDRILRFIIKNEGIKLLYTAPTCSITTEPDYDDERGVTLTRSLHAQYLSCDHKYTDPAEVAEDTAAASRRLRLSAERYTYLLLDHELRPKWMDETSGKMTRIKAGRIAVRLAELRSAFPDLDDSGIDLDEIWHLPEKCEAAAEAVRNLECRLAAWAADSGVDVSDLHLAMQAEFPLGISKLSPRKVSHPARNRRASKHARVNRTLELGLRA